MVKDIEKRSLADLRLKSTKYTCEEEEIPKIHEEIRALETKYNTDILRKLESKITTIRQLIKEQVTQLGT